ncbi:UDP-2,4-diacetamido-2,4,6-trideoxy-beta-L-altropy ranose hydrolase [Bacillus sp. J14TS2]|uniref:UDP-2,4-diacetamido-2,4, 6-trideoxy-beta-L-altropyranose hydrolase n=1 Tax=Bacillus sp. J14TS2 TaxID=2807188 RepID=UPI001B2F2298|nr:UDP-2,4-diacetamido-2,4,6-trideoxy-beta-L-altropyranose hydrolase [Bacillus sp. J14TS2]GIN74768.1 UDP-2,4-diacetamido-2,4,6-trideoxy-beta-L-altropy ranose hydrolase [Bacillus sp. J14TS2]
MNIIFRVDASEQIGTGHVMRCLTLAKQLQAISDHVQITFICRELSGNLISYIQDQDIQVEKLSSIDLSTHQSEYDWYRENWPRDFSEVFERLGSRSIDLLIVDHYGLDTNWEQRMKKNVKHLMVIDDLADRRHDCDILLDQNIQNHPGRYKGLVSESCKQLLGTDYLLLREEFIEMANNIQIRKGDIKNILVFFGGSDPQHLTLKTVDILQKISFQNCHIHVVVGSSNPQRNQIKKKCSEEEGYVYYCQIDYMAQLMKQADLAIGAGGATTWERIFLGLPSLTAVTADNQLELTKNIEREGLTISLGNHPHTIEITLKKTLENLRKHPHIIQEMSKKSLRFMDKERVRTYPVRAAILEALK